jgi:hypothetical protein
MKRFKFFLNYEKEEQWLSSMAAQGCHLKKVGFGYNFDNAPPEQAVIRIDYRPFKTDRDYMDYCSLFEDSGWRHIAGTKCSGAQYFKKISGDSNENIFSDAVSRAGRYKRVSNMWLSLFLVYFCVSIPGLQGFTSFDFLDLKTLYLTPGLWQMSGSDFWRHFLFETPFALMRGFAPLVLMLCVILFAVFHYKADKLYKSTINNDN